MARLPVPGSDDNSGDNVLNEFLPVSNREDGTLRSVREIVSVKDFGAVGDGKTDDTAAIATAMDAAVMDATPHSLFFPPGIYRMGASLTFAVPLEFACGAVLKPDAGVTLTIQREILAPRDMVIFDVSAALQEPACNDPCGSNCDKQIGPSPFAIRWAGKIYANWWSGSDIGARWNYMRASLPSHFLAADEAATLAIVGRHDVTTTMNWNDLRGTYYPVKIDLTEAHLLGKTNGKPVIEMINSRHVIVDGLTLYGWLQEAMPNVGLLIGRNGEGNASGEHLFSNFRVRGGYEVAAVYVVDSEASKWVNGTIGNDAVSGQYCMLIGSHNKDNICPRWAEQFDDALTMKGQWFKNVHWRGTPVQGGLYLYGADNIIVHSAFFKHGHNQAIPGPHLVLDTTHKTVSDCTFTDIFCEGNANTRPNIGCLLTGLSAVRNCNFEFKDFAATNVGFQVDVSTAFCKFRQWTADPFRVKSDRDMLYCEIETCPAKLPTVTLGRKFSGLIQIGLPETYLILPDTMEEFIGTVYDLERGLVRNHRIGGEGDTTFIISDTEPARINLARSRGTPGNEAPLQDGDVIGEYRFLARRERRDVGTTVEVGKIQAVYRGDGTNRAGDIRLVAQNGSAEHAVARAHHDGYLILQAQPAAIANAELNPQELAFYLDESSNQLMVKVKRSDGTVRTGAIPLSS